MVCVVILGQLYGSSPHDCVYRDSFHGYHRGTSLTIIFWALRGAGIVLILTCALSLVAFWQEWNTRIVDVFFHPLTWLVLALIVGGGIGWQLISNAGWTC